MFCHGKIWEYPAWLFNRHGICTASCEANSQNLGKSAVSKWIMFTLKKMRISRTKVYFAWYLNFVRAIHIEAETKWPPFRRQHFQNHWFNRECSALKCNSLLFERQIIMWIMYSCPHESLCDVYKSPIYKNTPKRLWVVGREGKMYAVRFVSAKSGHRSSFVITVFYPLPWYVGLRYIELYP